MTSRLNPYLTFDGNAREAMEFYQTVFGGELVINNVGDFGGADPAIADKVMHAQLETPAGYTLMGSDTMPGQPYAQSTSMTISLSGDADSPLREYWDKLADGGTVTEPLQKQMWGDEFGMCTDRYGVAWLVNISQSQS